MKLSLFLLSLAALGLALAPQSGSKALLAAHDKALKDAKGVEVTFTVQQLPGSPVEHKAVFAKPGFFRIETPTKVIVCDAKTLWEYNKADNTYTDHITTADEVAAILSEDLTWAWSAFFVPDQFKRVKAADAGAKRMIKGNQVTDIGLTMADGKTMHFYFDPKLGMARGASIKGETSELLILASDIKVGEPTGASFTFTPPAGAKKAEKKVVDVPYSVVAGIFQRSCTGCHGTSGGLNMGSHGAIMRGGRSGPSVVPGEPDRSSLYLYVTGKRQPRMPKNAPALSQSDIDTIRNWIASGAKQ
jgi:outer membrane lipoprotein-sorting protein